MSSKTAHSTDAQGGERSLTTTDLDPEVLRKFEEGCRKGNHQATINILKAGENEGTCRVARWCNICGSAVVDWVILGKIEPGVWRHPAILERR